MAGIVGIIGSSKDLPPSGYTQALRQMLTASMLDDRQPKDSLEFEALAFGNVAPLSCEINGLFVANKDNTVVCAVEGLVFINPVDKAKLGRAVTPLPNCADAAFLPELYQLHGEDVVHKLSGHYNIFLLDKKLGKALLFNDRLGLLPLHYIKTPSTFLFASRLEAILASGFMHDWEFDPVTAAEVLLFNFPVSEHSLIKDIKTLPGGWFIKLEKGKLIQRKYWKTSELLDEPIIYRKDPIDAINHHLGQAVRKISDFADLGLNLSLSGGWDSRLVLAYLLNDESHRLRLYSFGSKESPDVQIPSEIASILGLNYLPVVLDNTYLKSSFSKFAKYTVILSGGLRSYKRTHYLYAISQVAKPGSSLVSGIFGDEIFKVGRPLAGEVVTAHMRDLLDCGFFWDNDLLGSFVDEITRFVPKTHPGFEDEFKKRLEKLRDDYTEYNSLEEKFFVFRFGLNLRKYFGTELASYGDFSSSYSPFVDFDFLTAWARTPFFVPLYKYKDSSLVARYKSSRLYAELVKRNHPQLLSFNTARGYSMRAVMSPLSFLSVLIKKHKTKKKSLDANFTKSTDSVFYQILENEFPESYHNLGLFKLKPEPEKKSSVTRSMNYWMNVIGQRYR